ncbi:hypothetical protein AAC387_Pa01g4297 [Persea americana]
MASSNSSSSSSSFSSSSSYYGRQNPLRQSSSSSFCPMCHPDHTNPAQRPTFQSQYCNDGIHHLSQNKPDWNNTAETLQSQYSDHTNHHQINSAQTNPVQSQYPSSNDLHLVLQDLDSSFASFGLSDGGYSLQNHAPPPPPPAQFDNANDAYLTHRFIWQQQQQNSIELEPQQQNSIELENQLIRQQQQQQQRNSIDLENQLRMREALVPQMTSSYSTSPHRDYNQSRAPLQFRNTSNDYSFVCDCCLRHNTRRGSTSSSIQRNPNRNPLSPCPEYGGGRRFRMTSSFYNFRLESLCDDDIVQLAEEQEGCLFLQKKMEEGGLSDIQRIFSAVKDHICYLMIHQFGNYFVQKLFEVCSEEHMTEIILIVMRKEFQLIKICLNSHGSRTVQKLLEHLTTPQQVALVISALRPGTITLVNDTQGHHVVERCLVSFSNEYTKCLADEIANHCVAAARHQTGCCIVQKCLDCSEGEQKEHLLDEIIANALTLSEDTYGNYVMQFVLDLKIPHVTASILRQLEGSYASLSIQKCSSNVVEKCLKESEEEQRARIIRELINDPNALDIMQDPYGNYVMQRALKFSKGPIRSAIVNLVERESAALINHPFGKRVVAAIHMGKRL